MVNIRNSLEQEIIEIHKNTRDSIRIKLDNEKNASGARSYISGNAVEDISRSSWFYIGDYFGQRYNFDVSVIHGNRRKILCKKGDDAYIYSHVDVHVYINDEFFHGEECKAHLDSPMTERTFEVANRIHKEMNEYEPKISIVTLQPHIKDSTLNYFLYDDVIDNIAFLCDGNRSSDYLIWDFPINIQKLNNYFNYIEERFLKSKWCR